MELEPSWLSRSENGDSPMSSPTVHCRQLTVGGTLTILSRSSKPAAHPTQSGRAPLGVSVVSWQNWVANRRAQCDSGSEANGWIQAGQLILHLSLHIDHSCSHDYYRRKHE